MLFLFVFSGCTPVATYPPVETKAGLVFSGSVHEPVPTIMTEVVLYTHKHFGGLQTIVFNLPLGINSDTYSDVIGRISGSAPMSKVDEIAYHITELRVRGFSADADVMFPLASGGYGVATVLLKHSVSDGWVVVSDRVWLIPVDTPPVPNLSVDSAVGVNNK